MKIEKAIETLMNLKACTNTASRKDVDSAYQLGIEAMKCVLKIRYYPFPNEVLLLPGETKE